LLRAAHPACFYAGLITVRKIDLSVSADTFTSKDSAFEGVLVKIKAKIMA
jgi:hypothetical protein